MRTGRRVLRRSGGGSTMRGLTSPTFTPTRRHGPWPCRLRRNGDGVRCWMTRTGDTPRSPSCSRRRGATREERVPFMRGTLRIAEIESCTLDPRAGDAATLTDLRYDAIARIVTVEGVSGDVVAQVHRLDVTAELVTEVALWVRRRRGLVGVPENPLGGRAP